MSDSGSIQSIDSNIFLLQMIQGLNRDMAEMKQSFMKEIEELRATIETLDKTQLYSPPRTPDSQLTQDLALDVLAAITAHPQTPAKKGSKDGDRQAAAPTERPEVKAEDHAKAAFLEAVEVKSKALGLSYFNTVAEIRELQKVQPRETMPEWPGAPLTRMGKVRDSGKKAVLRAMGVRTTSE